jgi:ribosomal-protein-alanine N-acetyltransferase
VPSISVLDRPGHERQDACVEWTAPVPALRSGDVLLRLLRDEDAEAVAEACRDEAITRFTFMEAGLTPDGARRWIDAANDGWSRGTPRFAIVDATTDRLLGQIGMAVNESYRSAEIFYWVAVRERRRGVVSTALGLICDWAFANGIERLCLLIHPENEASHRVAAAGGFTREGILRAYEPFKGGRPDVVSWSLLPSDPRV